MLRLAQKNFSNFNALGRWRYAVGTQKARCTRTPSTDTFREISHIDEYTLSRTGILTTLEWRQMLAGSPVSGIATSGVTLLASVQDAPQIPQGRCYACQVRLFTL